MWFLLMAHQHNMIKHGAIGQNYFGQMTMKHGKGTY
jgi:hypothetical protein